jgi:polyhydroxyalkanoate synthesis regulator phasin
MGNGDKKERSIIQLVSELIEVASSVKCALVSRDFSSMSSLIERWQTLGNRMEYELDTQKDIESYRQKIRRLKKEIVALENKRDDLSDSEE